MDFFICTNISKNDDIISNAGSYDFLRLKKNMEILDIFIWRRSLMRILMMMYVRHHRLCLWRLITTVVIKVAFIWFGSLFNLYGSFSSTKWYLYLKSLPPERPSRVKWVFYIYLYLLLFLAHFYQHKPTFNC